MKYLLFAVLYLAPLCLLAQHHFIIGNGGQAHMSGGYLVLTNAKLENKGNFQSTSGKTIVQGTALAPQSCLGGTGTTQFTELEIDKDTNNAQLAGTIDVNEKIVLTNGHLDLNGHDIVLATGQNGVILGETETRCIIGTNGGSIIKQMDLNAPIKVTPGNMGLEVTSTGNLGMTTVRRGHNMQSGNDGTIIARYFELTPSNPAPNMDIELRYLDTELNSLDENSLLFWQNTNANTWTRKVADGQNSTYNIAFLFDVPSTGMITLGTDALFVAPKVALPSNYNSNTNLMDAKLLQTAVLPNTEPYTALGYTGLENAGATSTLSTTVPSEEAVDWILVELRDPVTPSNIIAVRAALLQRDGDVVDVDGKSPVGFDSVSPGSYYIAVRHRNHLGTMSAAPVVLSY